MIAVANGECKNVSSIMINCYRVSIKKQLDKLTITSQALPSFFLCEGAGRDIPDLKVTHLKWTSNEDSDQLLVGTKCSAGSFLELWSMVDRTTPIHKLFQNPNKTEVFKFVVSIETRFNIKSTASTSTLISDMGTSSQLPLYKWYYRYWNFKILLWKFCLRFCVDGRQHGTLSAS